MNTPTKQALANLSLTDIAKMLGVTSVAVYPGGGEAHVQDPATGHYIPMHQLLISGLVAQVKSQIGQGEAIAQLAGFIDGAHQRLNDLAERLEKIDGMTERGNE
jgi:hypothetical protein